MTGPALLRAIGRWSLIALVLNGVIGSSVFGLPSVIAGKLGSLSPLAWLVAALGIGTVVACFAEVASRFREAGGPYLYAREAFGRFAGIEMGWMSYLVRLTASATNANLFVIYLGEFWPAAQGPQASRLVLTAVIIPLAFVNYLGVRHGARMSSAALALKLAPLLFFVAAGLLLALPREGPGPLSVPAGSHPWLDAILLLVFAYGGFEAALVPLGEARDPRRDAPIALAVTLLVCAILYSLVQLVVNAALVDPAAHQRPLAAAALVFLGPGGAVLMALAAMVSVYGYLAGAMVNVPRLTWAMADRGDLPPFFGRIHPRFRTPAVSVGFFAVLVWALAASSGFLQNLTLSAVSRLFTYGAVCCALVVFRVREAAGPNPPVPAPTFRLPYGILVAFLGLGFSIVLATRMTQKESIALGVTLLLGALNWVWVKRRGPVGSLAPPC
jgi:amino acid transporter